jgi:thymidylate synthase (FAD)
LKVSLIAHTMLTSNVNAYSIQEWMGLDMDATEPDSLSEFAGRACYQSFDKPNPHTRSNIDYLSNILTQAHESVLEHASATFYVEGVSRSLTHELIRHRHLSFSELSQRYVDVAETEFVTPPAIEQYAEVETGDGNPFENWSVLDEFDRANAFSKGAYATLVNELENQGLPRKRAREAARAVMPNATETRIVVTGNIRAWRDVIKKRHHVAADAEIQQFARLVLAHLREIAPNSVQDIQDEPYGQWPY